MRLCILSDLHTEFERYIPKIPECDVLVLAGDHCNIKSYPKNTIIVDGNHDYYNTINKPIFQKPFVRVIDGVRFICTTGWSDVSHTAYYSMNDGVCIRDFSITKNRLLYKESVEFLKAETKKNFNGKTVVVTHHLPFEESIHPQYRNSTINSGFCMYLDPKDFAGVDLWIHGHTHSSVDYKVNGIRVICNPKGYYAENRLFSDRLVVEI